MIIILDYIILVEHIGALCSLVKWELSNGRFLMSTKTYNTEPVSYIIRRRFYEIAFKKHSHTEHKFISCYQIIGGAYFQTYFDKHDTFVS